MITLDEISLGKKAVEFYGSDYQIDICIEECAELIQALCHYKRKRSNKEEVCEEIADIYVALLSARQIFPEETIDDLFEKKSERLLRRIQSKKKVE